MSMRKTSPLITLMMLAGVIFLVLAQMFQSFSRTDFLCTFDLYLYHIGFILLVSGLLVKNYRIYRIFSNRTATALKITDQLLLMIAGIISAVFIAGVTVFVAVFGIVAQLKQSSSNIFYQYVTCSISNHHLQTLR